MQHPTPEEERWLQGMRRGDDRAVRDVYGAFRRDVVLWLIREYHCTEEDAADIYQETVVALAQGAQQGKLENLGCTLRTFVHSIAKNKARNFWRSQKKQGEMVALSEAEQRLVEEEPFSAEEIAIMQQHLQKLGEPCYTVLYQFYYQRFALEVIADRLGYKNAQVVRTQKSRCLKTLRDRILGNAKTKE